MLMTASDVSAITKPWEVQQRVDICILDSSEAVAKQAKKILTEYKLNAIEIEKPSHLFLTNSSLAVLQYFTELIGEGKANSHYKEF